MRAAQKSKLDIVTLLINAKADLNIKNENGKTALMLAEGDYDDEIKELLKKAGAT